MMSEVQRSLSGHIDLTTNVSSREAEMDFVDLSDANLAATVAAMVEPLLLIAFRTKENQICDQVEERLSKLSYQGKLRLARMDVETNPQTRERFGILSVPNVVLLKGSIEARGGWIGPWSESALQEFLNGLP